MLLGSAPWPDKEKNVIRIRRNDTNVVRWMCNVRLEEYHGRMFRKSKIAVVCSSRKNGRECLAE